eukprot:TRINITY_DN74433_c0_g1_i1.p1 TRINITY_DN74433_c0_g1~~TRINITY_DN74433_c0_g1_i1.p1  ORF type:complete len:693 (+),score=177.55 TRINITY_DN74433_c0_g1_i1:107-2185(+)
MPWPFGKKEAADEGPDAGNDRKFEALDDERRSNEEEEEDWWEETESQREERIRSNNLWQCFGIVLFFVYLFIFSSCVILEQSVSSSRLAEHVRHKLDSGPTILDTVVNAEDFFNYVEHSVLPALFQNNTDQRLARTLSESFYPMDISNRIMGSVRLRQVRVQLKENCQVGPMFSTFKVSCYPPISQKTESIGSFGPGGKFTWSADPDGAALTGTLASYTADGYMQLLSQNITAAKIKLNELREDQFLGPATRAVFIDFSVWSQNTGTYAAVTQLVEFGPAGGTHSETAVLIFNERTVKMGGQGYLWDWVSFLCLVIVILFVFWYMFEEFREFLESPADYFKDGWNVMDWINMLLILAAFGLRLQVWLQAGSYKIGQAALGDRDSFQNLRGLAESAIVARLLGALNAVLLWLKCVKYLRKVPVVKTMIRNIWDALYLFIPFLLLFCLAYIGFAMAFHIGFGDKIKELATTRSTVVYLARAYLRDVQLLPAYDIAPLFGATIILLFYVTMVLVGVTVVNAIFLDSIIRCKYDKEPPPADDDDEEESEPVEEFMRICDSAYTKSKNFVIDNVILKVFPMLHRTLKGSKKVSEADFDDMLLDALENDGDDGGGEDDESYYSDEEEQSNLIKREDLLRAVEHMSGRVLSEISIVGIEIRSELHDVCERVAQMQMAIEELSWRTDRVAIEQQEMIAQT